MELAPRYCRSCGSRILVKNVCHNCNNDPLKGENYCYDCGALTPNADSCLKCGARYNRSFPVIPLLIIGTFLIIAISVAVYFISRSNKTVALQQEKSIAQSTSQQETNKPPLQKISDTVVKKPTDTSAGIINMPNKPADTAVIKPAVDSAKKTGPNVFTSEELKTFKIRCTYFEKNQRSQVLFFIASGSGYIKVNEKIYELKRKRKGVDVAVFADDEYEATLAIDGLSGSAKEWLASCTLTVKDIVHNTSVKHKVYSPCIEL